MKEDKKQARRHSQDQQENDVQEQPKKEQEAPKKRAPIKPYVHVDTFLQTAIPFYGLSKMQASGFKAHINGRQYQRDEQVFVDELKKYLKID